MENSRIGWQKYLQPDVYYRLCNCRTIRADLGNLVNAKWLFYQESGKVEDGFTKEDALISILEFLDANSCCFELSRDEYNELCSSI